jgi:hypothetical protein
MEEEPQQDEAQLQLRRKIVAIMMDATLSEAEKAVKRQELMCGGAWNKPSASSDKENAADGELVGGA